MIENGEHLKLPSFNKLYNDQTVDMPSEERFKLVCLLPLGLKIKKGRQQEPREDSATLQRGEYDNEYATEYMRNQIVRQWHNLVGTPPKKKKIGCREANDKRPFQTSPELYALTIRSLVGKAAMNMLKDPL